MPVHDLGFNRGTREKKKIQERRQPCLCLGRVTRNMRAWFPTPVLSNVWGPVSLWLRGSDWHWGSMECSYAKCPQCSREKFCVNWWNGREVKIFSNPRDKGMWHQNVALDPDCGTFLTRTIMENPSYMEGFRRQIFTYLIIVYISLFQLRRLESILVTVETVKFNHTAFFGKQCRRSPCL